MNIDNSLSMLFSRLRWPSALVRERACVSIASLLASPQFGQIVYSRLLEWIHSQKLESLCILGILALCKAKDEFQLHYSGRLVWQSVSKPSILSWILVQELDSEYHIDFREALSFTHPEHRNLEKTAFFKKYIKTYVPGMYFFWAEEIEKKEEIPFFRIWESEWHALLGNISIDLSESPIRYWMGYSPDEQAVADTMMSEVYRSAFLRALARCAAEGKLLFDSAIYLASDSCPVDLDIWKIVPEPIPEWWPRLKEKEDATIDTSIAEIWSKVTSLWERRQTLPSQQYMIARASGAIIYSNTTYALKIMGIFQRTHGPHIPELEQIAKWYEYSPNALAAAKHDSPIRFDGVIYPATNCVEVFEDWSLLAAANCLRPVPRWQPWRLQNHVWVPSACLVNRPINFECSTNALQIYEDGREIGIWRDWTCGLIERQNRDLPSSSGEYLLLDRKFVENFAEDTSSSFCWLCQLTRYYQKDRFSESHKTYSDYRIFGASKVIRLG